MTDEKFQLDDDQAALALAIDQAERNFRRTPTWRKIDAFLSARQEALIAECSLRGLSDGDRAMLQGMLSLVQEMRLQMPSAIVQEAHAASTSPIEDEPESIRRPLRVGPDLM